MNIAVSGGCGFIGSHLVARLRGRGHTTLVLDKQAGGSTANLGRLEEAVTASAPDVFVHLGAQCSTAVSLRDPARDFTDNVAGTFNVCEVARRCGFPIVFVSSVKVLPGADGLVAPLGLSKRIGESYLQLYEQLYGVPVIIDRPSSVYGPGQDGTADSGWFTWFIRAALAGQRIEVAGDGTQSRDVLYIDDFVDVLVDQAEHPDTYAGQVYEVGGGPDNEVSLNELLKELGHTNTVTVPRLPGDLQRVVCDNSRLAAVAGWSPKVGWREGLARTRDSMRGVA